MSIYPASSRAIDRKIDRDHNSIPLYRSKLLPFAASIFSLLVLAGLIAGGPAPTLNAQGTETLIAYDMVDQWPIRDAAAEGLFQTPIDLDAMRDGRVFISDEGIGGVHLLLPNGTFTTPFGVAGGFPAQLGQAGKIAVGPDPQSPGFPFGAEQIYVLDPAVERVVIYDAEGNFKSAWEDIDAVGIAASMDGRVYVLDRQQTNVRVFSAFSGQEMFTIGERGLEDGQFSNLQDIDVSPDGRVLAVGDKRGLRAQLFDLATDEDLGGETPPAPATLRRVYDLRNPKYEQGDNVCRAGRMNALGEDKVLVGEGYTACMLDGRNHEFAIATSAASRTICKNTVGLLRVKAMTQSYYALAESDPNTGRCGEKREDLDKTPVVVTYNDELFKGVDVITRAASNENIDNPLLFAPESISMPDANTLFIADQSSLLRFFDLEGKQIAVSEDSTQAGTGQDFQVLFVIRATGSDVLGEIFGYYIDIRASDNPQGFELRGGIGRFRTIEKRTQRGLEKALESIWTDELITSFQELEVPAMAWNPVSKELLVVKNEVIEQTRSQDVFIERYSPDNGRKLSEPFDLPDDGESNPYVDMIVGADGRIFALDDLNDFVRIFGADGTPEADVPVAFDARGVAGGPPSPEGSVFVLREPGSIERYADDGRVTARLDGRPLDFSDPTTLTDIVVDGQGRVYVSDGQSSLISIFEPTESMESLPVPGDGDCTFRGLSSIDPTQVDLGDSSQLTLDLLGSCGIFEEPADILVTAPYFPRLGPGFDPARVQITEMTQMMSRVNFAKHQAGIIAYYTNVTVEQALTNDRSAFIQATRDITRFSPPNPDIKPRVRDALQEADKQFDYDNGRRKVIALLRPDYCNAENEFFPGQCAGYAPAEEIVQELRRKGVIIVVINSAPGAQDLATSDDDIVYGVENVHRRMVKYEPPANLATDLNLNLAVPGNMQVDESSISTGGSYTAPNLTWNLPEMDFGGLQFGMLFEPQDPGTHPIADSIVANFTDGWGTAQEVIFEIPEIEVIGPTATPVADTPTPTQMPPTETPVEPTATAEPLSLFLPWVGNKDCFEIKRRFDITLVVDVSSSMRDDDKIDAARSSMRSFIERSTLGPNADRIAIVDFASQAQLVQDLTSDRSTLDAALSRIETRSGTRIDQGLGLAQQVLQAGGRNLAGHVIVLLSDGQQVEDPQTAYAAGDAARAAGIDVYTIGLGAGADAALLTSVAGQPDRYFFAPSQADLAGIYQQILDSIPGCP